MRAYRRAYDKTEDRRKVGRERAAKRRQSDPQKVRAYQRKHYQTNIFACLIIKAKGRARQQGMEFDGLSDIGRSHPLECACCSGRLDYGEKSGKFSRMAPSLDRIDNTKGYVTSNVAVVCRGCNGLKRDGTLRQFELILAYMRRALPNDVPL
jgi:hypothetical protein